LQIVALKFIRLFGCNHLPNNSKYVSIADRYSHFVHVVILFAITNPHFDIIEQISVIQFVNDDAAAVFAWGVV